MNVLQTQLDFFRTDLFSIRLMRIGASFEDSAFIAKTQGSPVGDSGAYRQQFPLLRGICLHLGEHFWTGSDQAHIAFEHIDELREFVELVFSKESSQTSDAWIVTRCRWATELIGANNHRPEFENEEGLASESSSACSIESRPRRIQTGCRGYDHHHRPKKKKASRC